MRGNWKNIKNMTGKKIWIACTGIAAAIVAVYLGLAVYFSSHFYFNTVINGEDYSAKSVGYVQNHILDTSGHYSLTIQGRDEITDLITSSDIVLTPEFGNEFAEIIEKQDPFSWPYSLFRTSEYTVDTMVTYSKEELDKKIDELEFFKPENIRQPKNAYLSDYTENGYQIIPEDKGTTPIRQNVYKAIENAVDALAKSVDLDKEGCYTDAEVTSEDPELKEECEQKNKLTGVEITYVFGEDTEVLDGNTIKDWLTVSDNGIDLDPELVREYVNGLSRKYDTWGKEREFKTTSGNMITITEGAYGWWTNRPEETAELIQVIKSGQSGLRSPVYRAMAAQYGEDDIGDTYVEIDLTSQHLWVYKDGQMVVESDFVSGNVSKGYGTPVGIYGITYKERDATLRGEGYASPVSYWIPFNGNVGMHDASWRGSFGGEIYLRGGSHGCVNLPVKKAEKIYEYVEKGEPVIVYGGKTVAPPQELTPEQQLLLLIEAGLLNPDGTLPEQPPADGGVQIPVLE